MAFIVRTAFCFSLGILALIVSESTTPVVVKKTVVETIPERPIVIIHGDTLVYQIAFIDKAERERFIYSFNRFLKESSFSAERFDSAGVFTVLRIGPAAQGQAALPGTTAVADSGQSRDTGTFASIFQEPAAVQEDTATPPFGGSLRLYTPRASLDYPLSALVDAYPFAERIGNDSLRGYFRVANVSPASLTLQLAGKITAGNGKTVTVLDIIDTWTRYIRERPAEGVALFPECQGIAEFTRGREAVVRGFVAADNTTIRLKFGRPDPVAVDRLRTCRTLPAPFGLGRYAVKLSRENEDVLAPNRAAAAAKPFVNEILVRRGGDPNPILSYSLGRYDAMLLWSAADIDYARRNLLKNGTCSLVGRDRYFIALQLDDASLRAAIRSSLNIVELMNKFVKPEGALIAAIESDAPVVAAPADKALPGRGEQAEPVKILYLKGDAISKSIAERLLSSISQSGIKALLMPADRHPYEAALVDRMQGCFVGWAPQTVLTDTSEKLRLAAMFFNNERDEAQRIASVMEIPLFSIDWYLLAQEKVGLFQGKLGGIYVKQENK
jgi:hypothetical protein